MKILVGPEIKSMFLQEATSALSPENLKLSEGESLKAAAEYFYINLIFLLVLFPKTLYDQYDGPGTDNIYSCSGFVFGDLPALSRFCVSRLRGVFPRRHINTAVTFLHPHYQCLMPHL